MNTQDLKDKLQHLQATLSYKQGVQDQIQQNILRQQNRLQEIADLNTLYNKTSALLQHVSIFARKQVAIVFEQMVTEALQTILEVKTLRFKVIFVPKKNGTDVVFKLHDTILNRELDVMKSFGGGVKDIVSTILRVLVLELHKPAIQGPIILDEVGKNISKEYQANFGMFLQTLSRKLNRQIILITHSPIIAQAAEKIITVTKDSKGKAIINDGTEETKA